MHACVLVYVSSWAKQLSAVGMVCYDVWVRGCTFLTNVLLCSSATSCAQHTHTTIASIRLIVFVRSGDTCFSFEASTWFFVGGRALLAPTLSSVILFGSFCSYLVTQRAYAWRENQYVLIFVVHLMLDRFVFVCSVALTVLFLFCCVWSKQPLEFSLQAYAQCRCLELSCIGTVAYDFVDFLANKSVWNGGRVWAVTALPAATCIVSILPLTMDFHCFSVIAPVRQCSCLQKIEHRLNESCASFVFWAFFNSMRALQWRKSVCCILLVQFCWLLLCRYFVVFAYRKMNTQLDGCAVALTVLLVLYSVSSPFLACLTH